jgi:hypothetical protein
VTGDGALPGRRDGAEEPRGLRSVAGGEQRLGARGGEVRARGLRRSGERGLERLGGLRGRAAGGERDPERRRAPAAAARAVARRAPPCRDLGRRRVAIRLGLRRLRDAAEPVAQRLPGGDLGGSDRQ